MNTQQRAILSKACRLLAMDAEWDESKHPRAQNGRFGSGSLKDGKVNFPELSVSEIEALAKTPIAVTSEMGQGARKSAVKEWLRSNLQGKSVTASDGNRIYFTRNDTVSHISFNSQRSHLIAQCVPHLAAVFAEGEAVGFQESSHDRKDKSIIGFQVYRKQITLADGYQVRIEAHAAKREEGYLEFAAYTLKKAPASDGYSSTDIAENSTRIPDSPPDAGAGVKDNRSGADNSASYAARHVEYGLSSADNHTPAQNQMQGCEYAAYAHKKIDSKSEKVGNAPASIETAKDSSQAAGSVSYADNRTPSEKGSQNLHADDAADSIRKLEFGSTAFKVNPTPAADSAQEEYELFRIMKITDQNGRDVTETYAEDRLSLRPEQENKYYTIEAVELNEKSPAAQWVDSTVQADGPDPTSIRSVGDILSLAKTVEQNNMITKDNNSIAQDTARSYDKDGRLHVAVSNISKATVNPYYGSEIPNYRQLGLEPKKVYYLLRDPEELEKAAPTFNNLPLLNKHIPVSADEPQKEVIAGTTGSDTVFEDGYLKCSLAVWDAEAIAGIESGEQVELSSAYHYTADMTAGEFEGRHYDGVMRDIVGNHVALVDVGRAGRDVVVSDADPFNKKENTMKLKAGAKARIQAAVQPLLAQDAELSPDELLQVIGSLTNEVQTAQDDGKELPPENVENVGTDEDDSEDGENNTAPAEDEEPEAPEGGAPKPAQDAAISKMAMDAAIQKAVAAERKRAQALAAAQREVAHIVGDVAMDNAADVYKFALEQSGIDVTGVHPSAYRAMVGMLGKPKQPMAQDAAKAAEQFPGLSRIRKA
ncbi:DUF2213 domain-containing protein [Neisseria polysaccharea]|uniref:DUF2213 domain-containing protein n=1 Tax=Neisseria polysaccharea TaxID=489 RepID=A0ABV1JJ29_NEIPO